MNKPNTIEEAVFQFIKMLSPEQMDEIAKNGLSSVHFTTGMAMRNEWNLWKDCPLRRDAIKRWGLAHGDDLSGMIFGWVEAECKGEYFDREAYTKRIKEHWKRYGTTSCRTMGLNEDGTPIKS